MRESIRQFFTKLFLRNPSVPSVRTACRVNEVGSMSSSSTSGSAGRTCGLGGGGSTCAQQAPASHAQASPFRVPSRILPELPFTTYVHQVPPPIATCTSMRKEVVL